MNCTGPASFLNTGGIYLKWLIFIGVKPEDSCPGS